MTEFFRMNYYREGKTEQVAYSLLQVKDRLVKQQNLGGPCNLSCPVACSETNLAILLLKYSLSYSETGVLGGPQSHLQLLKRRDMQY